MKKYNLKSANPLKIKHLAKFSLLKDISLEDTKKLLKEYASMYVGNPSNFWHFKFASICDNWVIISWSNIEDLDDSTYFTTYQNVTTWMLGTGALKGATSVFSLAVDASEPTVPVLFARLDPADTFQDTVVGMYENRPFIHEIPWGITDFIDNSEEDLVAHIRDIEGFDISLMSTINQCDWQDISAFISTKQI